MNEYSKIIGYKIYTQKSVAFVYTNNELLGREIKETISFIITSKRIRYLGIKLPKEVKNLCLESCYKTLLKEIEDNTIRWKDVSILCSWIGRINIAKIITLLKAIYRFNAIPTKLPMIFFFKRNNCEICMETQKTLNYKKKNIEKEEQSRRNYIP